MSFLLKFVADFLLKGLGPFDGFKTVIGLVIAIAHHVFVAMGYEVPVLTSDWAAMIGYLMTAFGLGHKGGKAV